ncbi:Outer membrane protein beta-barrel domain-containing protein [Chryseolinea serpens]|uniref:Outer membrane protein beta-barrel domain-containing protein n=1 Tax=Chryseolinea serpens TaxID=947013 RepID=A0A1M5KT95_9BACT|nr:Outer membrane protein beta-barrel domain-containing protein [Chryseolinea serpens]
MKKLIIFSFVLVSSSNCFSQSFTKDLFKRLSFGVKAGVNYSNFANADFETDGLVGFHAGGLVNFKLNERLSIEEEFLFSLQGAKLKGVLNDTESIKLYYMTVPILLKYRTNSGIYFEAGPQVSALMKEDLDKSLVDGQFAKKLDFGVTAGLGFQAKNGLGIGARYVAGLSDVGDFQSSIVKNDFRNSTVQASVFYVF